MQGVSPVGCVAALAVLDIIEKEGLCARATEIGERIVLQLQTMQARYPQHIGDVRNLGAMIAMELVHDGGAQRPNPELTAAIVAEAAQQGLILLPVVYEVMLFVFCRR